MTENNKINQNNTNPESNDEEEALNVGNGTDAAASESPADEAPESETPEVVVGFTMEEVDAMQAELKEAKAQAADFQDRWQRALADFSNLKRRTEREQGQMKYKAVGEVVTPFLTVIDDLTLALQNRPTNGDGAAWAEGIELILRKLQNALEIQGVTLMEIEGEFFDPNFHEAISHEPSADHESGQIIAAVKPGYLIGDRVLRPAMVRVAA